MSSARTSRRVVSFESMEPRRLFAAGLLSDALGLSAAPSIEIGGTSYFFADDGIHGRELWKSDGTPQGTVLVKDLTPGATGSDLHTFFHAGTRVVFLTVVTGADDDDYTLWSSDGSSAGTIELADLFDAEQLPAVQAGERVAIIHAYDGVDAPDLTDADLYFTDGTRGGTSLVRTWRAVASDPDSGIAGATFSATGIWATGGRVVFHINSLWASDGTAGGTVNLDPVLRDPLTDFPYEAAAIFEANGKVYIPGPAARVLWESDGTVGGTTSRAFAVTGNLEYGEYGHDGNLFYFVDVSVGDTVDGIRKTLWAYDLSDHTLTEIFRTPTDSGANVIRLTDTEGPILFEYMNADSENPIEVWSVRGTSATKLMNIDRFAGIWSPVTLDGVTFFVLASKTTQGSFDVDPDDQDGIGELGSRIDGIGGPDPDGGGAMTTGARGGETAWLHLWRTDGTVAGTGIVRTIWEGDPGGKQITGSIVVATGKLLLRTEISTGVRPGRRADHPPLVKIWDDTLAYEPDELNIARDGAIARVVNGVLRLNGSSGPDSFHVYRLADDPSKLVVEYNGNTRVFAFNAIRRIVADLQDGNDTLDIDESVGGEIRLWTSILGGDGADTILTGVGRDTIIGGSGGDTIRSRGNADAIIGGGGRDRITSGQGDDIIVGGSGEDSIIAGTGHDVLFGQNAVEQVFGSLWDDGDTLEDLVLQSL